MSGLAEAIPNVAATLIDTLIASNRGDRQAFSYNAKRYSYQDVAALMNRAGGMLKGLGLEPGARVLLLLPPSPAFVASVLGALKAGAVPVLGAPREADALAQCIAATRPAAAIVHEGELQRAETALAAIAKDAIVVVGNDGGAYKSFVAEMRAQPSWLAAPAIAADAPALALWSGSAANEVSHAELAAFAQGSGQLGGNAAASTGEGAALGAVLRAFAKGDEATLV